MTIDRAMHRIHRPNPQAIEKTATNGKIGWMINESKTKPTKGTTTSIGLTIKITRVKNPEPVPNPLSQSSPIHVTAKPTKKNPTGKQSTPIWNGKNTIENGMLRAYSNPSICERNN